MNKNIKPASVATWAAPECAIKWTGYAGAIPADTPNIRVYRHNGDTIVSTELGESWNCHPYVKACGYSYDDKDYQEGVKYQYDAGVYPVRFRID